MQVKISIIAHKPNNRLSICTMMAGGYLLPDPLPFGDAGTAGALFNGTPVVCGGDSGGGAMAACLTYKNKAWARVSQGCNDIIG